MQASVSGGIGIVALAQVGTGSTYTGSFSVPPNVSQSSQLVELLGGIRVVKAFGLENEQLVRFRKTSGQIVHAGMKGVQAKELVNPILEIISVLGLGLLLLYVFKSGRTGRDLATFLTGVVFFFQPIKKLAGLHILFGSNLQEANSAEHSAGAALQSSPGAYGGS